MVHAVGKLGKFFALPARPVACVDYVDKGARHGRKRGRDSVAASGGEAYIIENRPMEESALNPTEVAHRVVDIASDLQAEDIVLLDIRGQAIFADYFVIMTAGTDRQARALRDDMVKRLKFAGVILNNREGGRGDSGWVLLDFGDVIVHIFGAEQRDYYRLEELWSKAPQVVRIQ